MSSKLPRHVWLLALAVLALVVAAPGAFGGHATDGPDVKVTNDNNNVDGGTPNPGFDAQNRQSNETSVAISPVGSGSIVAASANDYRMVTVFGDVWQGIYVSSDRGSSWFNTMVPGFPSDTTAAGGGPGLLGLDAAGDPVVRFDSAGNLYAAGIGFNRNYDRGDRPLDTVVYVAKYDYTPGSPAGVSTPNSAGNPPNFTYRRTTIVDRGAVGFATPGVVGFTGTFTDKEWMEIDLNSPAASKCSGNIYTAHTNYHGPSGSSPTVFTVSSDGGVTFSSPRQISTGGASGSSSASGVDIAVASNGTVYIAYEALERNTGATSINLVKSTDCGKHWTQPLVVGIVSDPQAPGVAFRTPTFAFVSVDDTNPNLVYVAYQSFAGDFDIYAQRSTNGGSSWSAPVQVNTDPGARHQVFPTIDVSNHALHVGWYDFRNSITPANEALDVYYACTGCDGVSWPAFSHETRVTDVSHNGNCLLFGGGTAAFHGDYNELDARWTGSTHQVNIAWADNRDVSPCDLDPAPGPASNNTGNRNQNIYADRLTVSP